MTAASFLQLPGVPGEAFELPKSLVDGKLQVFPKQRAVYVFLVRFDHGIGIVRRCKLRPTINHFAHIYIHFVPFVPLVANSFLQDAVCSGR